MMRSALTAALIVACWSAAAAAEGLKLGVWADSSRTAAAIRHRLSSGKKLHKLHNTNMISLC